MSDTQAKPSFRLLKYASRPVQPRGQVEIGSVAQNYSLAAYIMAELHEIGQAHACHRFVCNAIEDHEPRILVGVSRVVLS